MAIVEHRLRPVEDAADPSGEGARAQLECLYREHAQRVFAICASVLRNRHEAEDAAQQVFLSAFRALLRGSEPADPSAWLATIARNESWSRARREPIVPLQPELRDVTQEDPSTVVVRRGELAGVWQAIEALPASQRTALLLREVRGLGYDELVAELELSHPSVRSLLNRARRTLRGRLEKGAAALTGAPWLNLFARIFGDASSPVLSSASRTAAVGLGAIAISGGAVIAPSLTGPARHHLPAAAVVAHPTVPATGAVEKTQRQVAAVPVALATPPGRHAERRDDDRAGESRSRGRVDQRLSDGVPGGGRAGDDGSSGEGRGADSSGSSSGTGGGGHDGSGSGGTSEGGLGPSTSGGSGPSHDSQTLVVSSSPGGSSGPSGDAVSDGGSSGGGSASTSDGGGGSGSSGSSGSDDGSGGSSSSGSDS